MYKKIILPILFLSCALVFALNVNQGLGISISEEKTDLNKYEKEWGLVQKYETEGLPESALKIVEDIYIKAKEEGNSPQIVKCIIHRLLFSDQKEEKAFEKVISEIETEAGSASSPLKNVLYSTVAELYWWYYQANRWKFINRSKTVGIQNDDIETWDLNKLAEVTTHNYELSLENSDKLKSIPTKKFEDVIVDGASEIDFRPTLYDFLAHRALDYYINNEAGLSEAVDEFKIDRAVYLSPFFEFSATDISTSKENGGFNYKAIVLINELIKFHKNDTSALVDIDLKRLRFVNNQATSIPNVDELFENTLQKSLEMTANHQASTRYGYELALLSERKGSEYQPIEQPENQWDRKKAYDICQIQIDKFPKSIGARDCANLQANIKNKSFNLSAENVLIPDSKSRAVLEYRNVNKLNFRLLRIKEIKAFSESRKNSEELLTYYLQQELIKNWKLDLPQIGDYQAHKIDLPLPELKQGRYVILISEDETFPKSRYLQIQAVEISVSDLAYTSRHGKEGTIEYYLTSRKSGLPIKGVKIAVYNQNYDYVKRSTEINFIGEYFSDQNGKVVIGSNGMRASMAYCIFSKNKDTLSSSRPQSIFTYRQSSTITTTTHYFTDRKIYRPGQTIFFKGIVLSDDGKDIKPQTNYSVVVNFYDVNNQLISKQSLKTNDFGTFNGSFTAPQGILNGTMRISDNNGSHIVSVEDYKRPKFEVQFDPLKGAYKLGEKISVKGRAISYSGAPVSEAKLSYRIVRNANYSFYYWYRPRPSTPTLEIAQGEITTDESGKFSINFEAIGENKSENEFYNFTVYTDVTDINGETQSNQKSVSVGSQALLISADIADRVDINGAVEAGLKSTNLNGEFVSSEVKVKIWKLKQPDRLFKNDRLPRADLYLLNKEEYQKNYPFTPYLAEDEVKNWERSDLIFENSISTSPDTRFLPFKAKKVESGKYVIQLSAIDTFGTAVSWEKYLEVYNSNSTQMPLKSFDWFEVLNTKAEVGESVSFIIGSSAENSKVLYEIEHDREILSSSWIDLNKEKKLVKIPVLEKYRGNFAIHLTMVKEGELYTHSQVIIVPYSNKELSFNFSTFRDKLLPGQDESWTVKISGPDGEKVSAELLTSMYDASLDQFVLNTWDLGLYKAVWNNNALSGGDNFGLTNGRSIYNYANTGIYPTSINYERLNWFGYSSYRYNFGGGYKFAVQTAKRDMVMADSDVIMREEGEGGIEINEKLPSPSEGYTESSLKAEEKSLPHKNQIGIEPVKTRTNFNETAFFYPELMTDSQGNVTISFTIPESLTKWKLLGLAHTKDLKTGVFTKEIITQKSLMVVSNPPRFFRQGDEMTMSVKLSNLRPEELEGNATITFLDVFTGKDITPELLQKDTRTKDFTIKSEQNSSLSWKVAIPDNIQAVTYRVEAKSENFSDGEEYMIPVLTNRMLVTESMPLNVKGDQTKEYTFDKLLNSSSSSTLRHERLTLEYTSNPAWYAIQALPYLMEYPYECAEQLFSRYYANSIAAHIANSSPKIKAVFDSWKMNDKEALLSNLEKNQELKSLLLEETPWVLEARDESERKKRLGLLFDINHIGNQLESSLRKLREMQYSSGSWPWFKGMEENRYITQHIVSGFGHLKKLGVFDSANEPSNEGMIESAVKYLDMKLNEDYQRLIQHKVNLSLQNISSTQIQYLYARSFFTDIPLSQTNQTAYDYYMAQAKKFWLSNNLYLQGMIALTMNRSGDHISANAIINSLNEKAIHHEEMGMYWKINRGYYWQNAPIERQALFIEAYGEITQDSESVEEMKLWLLKQKQTQDWKTTRATTEACYALLMEGMDLLDNDVSTDITLGNTTISTDDPTLKKQAGTGYFKKSWTGSEIKAEMGRIKVNRKSGTTNNPSGVSWGAVYWQYFENLDKITSSETPLSIKKQVFVEEMTKNGPQISAISSGTEVKVGDKVVVRIELRVDRDMSYVHMKDMRASGLEPTNVFSGYRYQDGLGYYETTRDAATNFFFDYLRKGTYVFEYSLRASIAGNFSNGITSIQCMYAPEFTSNSEGIRINILP